MSSGLELNARMFNLMQISSQDNMLLKSIEPFYSNINYINDFISIITADSKISIRLIDYFITKYAKKYKIIYKINEEQPFNVYQSYKQQLKIYQKKNFDPFARGIKIPYYIGNSWVITTLGQLNFFKWFISKNILEFVIKNKDIIEIDMNKNKKTRPDIKIKKTYKKYKKSDIRLSNNMHCPFSSNNKTQTKIIVTF
jgi:hypothetical protein